MKKYQLLKAIVVAGWLRGLGKPPMQRIWD